MLLERIGGTRLAVVGLALAIGVVLLAAAFANSCGDSPADVAAEVSDSSAPAAGSGREVDDRATRDQVQTCAATELVDLQVQMQPQERGEVGTRTLGTLTLSTSSGEPLRVWVLVDEGEAGDQSWSREAWQSAGPSLARGAPVEERLSKTVYDDGDSTWRSITAVAAWHTGAECADLPTDAQLDEIAAPV